MQKTLDICLKLFKVLFELFPICQTLGANTTKRQILGSTQLNITAAATRAIFSAACTGLQKNRFRTQNASDDIHEFLDVVAAFYGEDGCFTVIIKTQMHKRDEFFFFNPWKLEGFLV